jgi:hypothetical protein
MVDIPTSRAGHQLVPEVTVVTRSDLHSRPVRTVPERLTQMDTTSTSEGPNVALTCGFGH